MLRRMSADRPWVVKYGGNAMSDAAVRRSVAAALGALSREGRKVVIVHGGGPAIAAGLEAAGIPSRFVRGRRITGEDAIEVVETALTLLGKRLAQEVGEAVALTGRDAALLKAEVADPELGRVGRMTSVRADLLEGLLSLGLVPVVACLAGDDGGRMLNVNGDEVAGAVAATLRAPVAFLTDVAGVLDDPADPLSRLSRLDAAEARERIADGRIRGGMIPKVESALAALELGAPLALIADGRDAAGIAPALSGRGGTRIMPGPGGASGGAPDEDGAESPPDAFVRGTDAR